LRYLHYNNIAHRDVKPANMLVSTDDRGETVMKLSDFGVSSLFDGAALRESRDVVHNTAGTVLFMAPEMMTGDSCVDIWAAGITLYMMVRGQPPIVGAKSIHELHGKLRAGVVDYRLPCFQNGSPHLLDLLQYMLDHNAETRPTIDDIVEHPYVKGLLTEMEGPAKANVSATDVERAVSYHFGGVVNAKIMSHRMKRRASNPTLSSSSS